MTGTTLLIGGSGKTPSRIASKLGSRGIPVLLTSRKGQAGVPAGYKGVTFDWFDESTYSKPFEADSNIDTIYIVLPPPTTTADWIALSKKFIDFAKAKGVNRFLLMSVSQIEKGGPAHGQIHEYLDTIGVDYAVLRPSWFYSNFITTPGIKERDEFVTATGTGKVGFISEDDIADTAVQLLSLPKLGGTEKIIVGPDPLSYDEAVEIFSQVLGRKITHRKVSKEERIKFYTDDFGLPDQIAAMLGYMEVDLVAKGKEEEIYARPDKVVGKVKLRDFIKANKQEWLK